MCRSTYLVSGPLAPEKRNGGNLRASSSSGVLPERRACLGYYGYTGPKKILGGLGSRTPAGRYTGYGYGGTFHACRISIKLRPVTKPRHGHAPYRKRACDSSRRAGRGHHAAVHGAASGRYQLVPALAVFPVVTPSTYRLWANASPRPAQLQGVGLARVGHVIGHPVQSPPGTAHRLEGRGRRLLRPASPLDASVHDETGSCTSGSLPVVVRRTMAS